MPNLIETLIGEGVQRHDKKRLTITTRPPPLRPRQLLELFVAMGSEASFPGLRRALDLTNADAQTVTYAVLGRWPTQAEVAAFPAPYEAPRHMQDLIRSREFRARMPQLTCDAFPERKRLLYVYIPASAGTRVMATLDSKHPVLPIDLTDKQYSNAATLATTIGTVLSRLNSSNTLALIQPTLGAFCDPEWSGAPADSLAWHNAVPPCRPADLLFAIIRDPAERALAYVNRSCAAMRGGKMPLPEALRADLGLAEAGPRAQAVGAWPEVARWILANMLHRNPVCHALGDGTSAGAMAACRRVPMQLLGPDQFRVWGRTALDTIPPDAEPEPDASLRLDALVSSDRDKLESAIAEDRSFHARFIERLAAAGIPSVRGQDL